MKHSEQSVGLATLTVKREGQPNIKENEFFMGRDFKVAVGGIHFPEIHHIRFDASTNKGFFQYELHERIVEKDFIPSIGGFEIDIYFDNGSDNRFVSELDGVTILGASMVLDIEGPASIRQVNFEFHTETMNTYMLEDAPWHEQQSEERELVEV